MNGYPNVIVLEHLERALRDLLDGRCCLTEGVRNVVQWRHSNHGLERELFMTFVGVDSETDRFPMGAVREKWAEKALENIDAERLAAEQFYGDDVIRSSRSLLEAVLATRPQATYTDPRSA